MMFGVGTVDVPLHAKGFKNMLGEDKNGWGLSHKGLIQHGGISYNFTQRFSENEPTTIGLLFDSINGTLTYFKDGECLGVAFRGLNKIQKPLYPYIISTAAKTEMVLGRTLRDFPSLKDRCCGEILKHIKLKSHLEKLDLPHGVVDNLSKEFLQIRPHIPIDNPDHYKV